jgi:hypothetical protein
MLSSFYPGHSDHAFHGSVRIGFALESTNIYNCRRQSSSGCAMDGGSKVWHYGETSSGNLNGLGGFV